ncbi:Uncharacterised protein [Escherichia coli]|uniref:Uncharacterized protein n=1 Tax=Escherichia coli TaxID=562 RepID=A0A484X2V9_ECOLX|nr:Uncharacterised protein [Escherichia coli]
MTRLTVLVFSCCILFMKQFTEHRINIILVADMLHRKVVESRLQMAHILATVSDARDV